jgi:hydrogenase maturation protein HypF
VQGVWFRPAVWRIAKRLGLCGEVLNDSEGVLIHAFGRSPTLAKFALAVVDEAPPLSRIDAVETARVEFENRGSGLIIVESQSGKVRTGIVPDAAACPDCLADIRDPENRRFRYPFTNCTHCGPRLSICARHPI